MSKLRDPRCFVLETIPIEADQEIHGSKLPTVRQVLLCFLSHHTLKTKRAAANTTVKTVLPFYLRAKIDTLKSNKMAEEVLKVFEEMKSIIKIDHARRETETNKQKINSFKEKLKTTMKFWPRNSLEKIKIEEDKQFLISMMTDRKATMGSIDTKLKSKKKNIWKRKEAEQSRVDKEQSRQIEPVEYLSGQSSESGELSSDDVVQETQAPPRSRKRVMKCGTSVFIPHDLLKYPAVVETAVRNKILPTALTCLLNSLITATSGVPSRVNLHYSTAIR